LSRMIDMMIFKDGKTDHGLRERCLSVLFSSL